MKHGLALDVGGAYLKAADGRGYGAARCFALWRAPDQLAQELGQMIANAPACDCLAATMTGELADCFSTKAEGVAAIVEAIERAVAGRPLAIYSTSGDFLSPAEARQSTLAVAASNWHALAAFAARFARGRPALLVDVGSTTADVIPLGVAGPEPVGRTDPDRLLSGELVYTGVERTPIAAIVSSLPWRGRLYPVASELFATASDAHLLLGHLPEEPSNCDTADGRPRTRDASHARLARMLCADATMFSLDDAAIAAQHINAGQEKALRNAVNHVVGRMRTPPESLILSGHGEFLAAAATHQADWPRRRPEMISLNKLLGPDISRCATAHALAVLFNECASKGSACQSL
jgi:probable H4MPT-linked C1 transfer pathway protein